jgi:hypothetical protein
MTNPISLGGFIYNPFIEKMTHIAPTEENCDVELSLNVQGATLEISGLTIQMNNNSNKIHPTTGHEGPEGETRYSYTLSLTSALDGCGWSTPRPGPFTPRKETRYPLCRRLGVPPQDRCGRVRKISPPSRFDSRTVQPVANRYTDWAIPAIIIIIIIIIIINTCAHIIHKVLG